MEDLATTAATAPPWYPGSSVATSARSRSPASTGRWNRPRPSSPITAAGSPPILVIGNTGDSATPYESARRIAGTLEHGRLLTYHGAAHTTYGKDDCADAHIDAYLLELTLPPSGTDCPE